VLQRDHQGVLLWSLSFACQSSPSRSTRWLGTEKLRAQGALSRVARLHSVVTPESYKESELG
jgi:hypothetical protein